MAQNASAAAAAPGGSAWPLQSQCDSYYGDPRGAGSYDPNWAREHLTHVHCPWALHMGTIAIPHIAIHKRCAASLTRVLARVWEEAGRSEATIRALRYDVFSGSFVYRAKRGHRRSPCTPMARRSTGTRRTIRCTRAAISSPRTAR